MAYTTLISTTELEKHLDDPNWAIVDCCFVLAQPDQCEQEYLEAHIPTAVYAHLDRDLSGPVTPGKTSRHPLPTVERAAQVFAEMGIGTGVQVVAYDNMGGALAAVRLWWMLRWLGHESVAVLDGGLRKWLIEDRETKSGRESRPPWEFTPTLHPEMVVSAEQVDAWRQDPACRVFDARAPERYRGEVEPIDPVAGHIPGAISANFKDNLAEDGTFKPVEALRSRFQALLGEIPAENSAFYCGSGVTSIHNILAIKHIGLGEARLYAGSWSEWITDPARPVAGLQS